MLRAGRPDTTLGDAMTEFMGEQAWIGVDLDGTLAVHTTWHGIEHIGAPIPKMVERVKQWLSDGINVRILTARVSRTGGEGEAAKRFIERWCLIHLGTVLPVTCKKDFAMIELWDDRAVQVIPNEGTSAVDEMKQAAEYLWLVLANVSGGNWGNQHDDWQDAAAKARDQFHDVCRKLKLKTA